MNITTHHILKSSELTCTINALDVLDEIIQGNALDADLINDLRDNFPRTLIEQTRQKFYQ